MGFDFNSPEDFERFLEMDDDDKREFINEGLAEIAEQWMDDGIDDQLGRSLVGAMRAFMEGAMAIQTKEETPNAHVAGIWLHAYKRFTSDFQSFSAISKIKKSLREKGD